MAASSGVVDDLTDEAKAICQQQELWSEWQPELFAGILCYQQQDWQQSFKFLAASVVNGNIIAIDYLLAVVQQKTVTEAYKQFQLHNPKLDKHLNQLAQVTSPHALAPSWLSCSDYYLLYTKPARTKKQRKTKQAELKNLQAKASLTPHGAWANFLLAQIFKKDRTKHVNYLIASAQGGNLHAMFALQKIKFFLSAPGQKVTILLRDFNLAQQAVKKEQRAILEHLAKQTQTPKWILLAANMGSTAGVIAAAGIKKQRYDLKWLLHGAYLKNYLAIRILVILLENKNPRLAFLQDERLLWNECLYDHPKATVGDKARTGLTLTLGLLWQTDENNASENYPTIINWLIPLYQSETLDSKLAQSIKTILIAIAANINNYPSILPEWDLVVTLARDLPCDARQQALRKLYHYYCSNDLPIDETFKLCCQLLTQDNDPLMQGKVLIHEVEQLLTKLNNWVTVQINYDEVKVLLDRLKVYIQTTPGSDVIIHGLLMIMNHAEFKLEYLSDKPQYFIQNLLQLIEPAIATNLNLSSLRCSLLWRYGKDKKALAQLEKNWSMGDIEAGFTLADLVRSEQIKSTQSVKAYYLAIISASDDVQVQQRCFIELTKTYLNYSNHDISVDEVIEYCEKALASNTLAARFNHALILEMQGKTEAAIIVYATCVEKDDTDAMIALARCYGDSSTEYYNVETAFRFAMAAFMAGNKRAGAWVAQFLMTHPDLNKMLPEPYSDKSAWEFLSTAAQVDGLSALACALTLVQAANIQDEMPDSKVLIKHYLDFAYNNGCAQAVDCFRQIREFLSLQEMIPPLLNLILKGQFDTAWQLATSIHHQRFDAKASSSACSSQSTNIAEKPTSAISPRLQHAMKTFIELPKVTSEQYLKILERLAYEVPHYKLSKKAAGSRVQFKDETGASSITFHPRHQSRATVEENRKQAMQQHISSLI